MRPVLPLERRIWQWGETKGALSHGNNLFHDLGNGCMNLLTWIVFKTPKIKEKQA